MNRKDNFKLNNKGVSLIEIVVVVIIIGIMATAVIVNIGQVYGRNAMNAANKLSDVLDAARIEAMNKADGNVSVRICVIGGNVVAKVIYTSNNVETEGEVTVLCNTGLTVEIMEYADANEETEQSLKTISETVSYDLRFSKSTGAFVKSSDTEPKIAAVKFTGMRTAETVLVWETGRNYTVSMD